MSLLAIERTHSLGLEEAMARTRTMVSRMQQELALECAWQGDTARFQRPGVEGSILVQPHSVIIEVKLSMFLVMLRPTLEREVHHYFDNYFS